MVCPLIEVCDICIADRKPQGDMNPYQIHITIDPESRTDDLLDFCSKNLVKIHQIQKPNGKLEFITSTLVYSLSYPKDELHNLQDLFCNFKILRVKVEVPFSVGRDGLYHETHWSFKSMPPGELNKGMVSSSYNPISGITYVTFRSKIPSIDHLTIIQSISEEFNYTHDKIRSETCLYDSNEDLDNDWVKCFE